jgi:hypothetical protein
MVPKRLACLIMLALAVLSLVKPRATAAQEYAEGRQQPDEQQTIEKRALALLNEVIGEARTLRLAENRVRLQVSAADIVWPYDEPRARALLQEAINNFSEIMEEADFDETEDESLLQRVAESREMLLKVLARHDPQLAQEFLRTAGKSLPPDDELDLNLKLSAEVASSDPTKAAQLAEESLAKGFSYQLSDLILQLQAKDPEAATRLVNAIVAKLHSVNVATNKEAANIAQELLLMGIEPHAHESRGARSVARTVVNQQSMRELVEMIAAAVVRAPSSNPEFLLALQPLLPEVEKYAPTLAPSVRRRVAEVSPPVEASEGYREEESVEEAANVEPGSRAEAGKRRPRANEERAAELIEQATSSEAKGKDKRIIQLLNEARTLLGDQARNNTQLRAQLHIAQAYALLDPTQSFEIIEPLTEQLNSLADAVLTADGFINEEPLTRNNEFLLRPISDSIQQFLEEDRGRLNALVRADFGRTRAIADRFQRPELRALARFLVVQSVLDAQPGGTTK